MRKWTYKAIATYVYLNTANNTTTGAYDTPIEDIIRFINDNELEDEHIDYITREDYDEICKSLYDLYENAILDINNGEDDYYYEDEMAISLNIGGCYYINNGDTYLEEEED